MIVECAPQGTVELNIPYKALPTDISEAYLLLEWRLNEPTELIDTDFVVAYDQFVIPCNSLPSYSEGSVYPINITGPIISRPTTDNGTRDKNANSRYGVSFTLDGAYDTVTYLGRSGEAYVDRCQAGLIGIHTEKVEDMFHPYVMPQATGNRMDVRWLKISSSTDPSLPTLLIYREGTFQFTALPYSDEAIEAAKHLNELVADGLTHIHLDLYSAGVGTGACGPGVLPPYRVPENPTDEFDFVIEILNNTIQ